MKLVKRYHPKELAAKRRLLAKVFRRLGRSERYAYWCLINAALTPQYKLRKENA